MKRHEAREKALQVLFQLDNTELTIDDAISHILEEDEQDAFFEQLVRGTADRMEEIDAHLKDKLENWSLHRLPKIERTVLRLAVYELLWMEDVPNRVVLNEAIELCKHLVKSQVNLSTVYYLNLHNHHNHSMEGSYDNGSAIINGKIGQEIRKSVQARRKLKRKA